MNVKCPNSQIKAKAVNNPMIVTKDSLTILNIRENASA